MTIQLSIGMWTRDLTDPLLHGEVEPEGIDANVISEYPPKRHRRFFERREFDVCEVSLASYLTSRTHPEEYPFTAIPVFPCKRFPHTFFYKHKDVDIDDPGDLAGKKVGIQSWQTTRDVWMRGIAAERYGLELTDVHWYRRKEDDVPLSIPDRFDIQPVSGGQQGEALEEPDDLKDMLLRGDLDAAMDPANAVLHSVVESEDTELMFDDPLSVERDYYEDTGLHPPMHVVAIREDVLEDHPWAAVNIYDAFCEARDICLERAQNPARLSSLTWGHLHRLEQDRILGRDVWEYGLTDRSVPELKQYMEYAEDQGLIPRRYDLEELFVDGTVARR
jgi:4,5-dihydroxyphthalate decarboxylase